MSEVIDNIIDISITRATAGASIVSFNDILIIGEFLKAKTDPAFNERVRLYTDLSEMIDDGWDDEDPEYLMFAAITAQNPNIGQVYVGRKLTGGDGSETWGEALTAMKAERNDWYGIVACTKTLADLEAIADWTESNTKLFIASDDDANIIDATGDIAEYVNGEGYDRTAIIYHDEADLSADDPCAEAAWMGYLFSYSPGSVNWAFKTLTGVSAYELTGNQRSTAEGKKCNLYEAVAGINMTRFGWVGSGEYIDIIHGCDYMQARIQQALMTLLANSNKVPFTDGGIQGVKAIISGVLQEFVDSNFLIDYSVSVPEASDVSAEDKANRTLNDVTFTGTLANAINHIQIRGTVSY